MSTDRGASTSPPERGLARAVGRWDLTALAINGLIGSAIFGLPAGVARLVGPWGPAACLLCGLIVLLIVLCFAETSSLFEGTGGPYLYAREAFGTRAGFAGGWMIWLARVTAFAANVNLLVSYAGYFAPSLREGLFRAALISAAVLVLTAVNIRGVRQGALLGDLLAAAKMVPMVAFVALGLFALNPEWLRPGPPPDSGSFGQAILLYVFAFTGFEYAAIPAGEALAPRRHLPAAMLTAIIAACFLYTGIQTVCQGTLAGLAGSQTAMADSAASFLGPAGGAAVAVTAILSILGNLSGMALISPRITFALAEDGLLPGFLRAVNARFRTPHASILLYAVCTLSLALSGTFVGMVRISAVARIVPYALTALAVPVLRRKLPDAPARFRLRGGALIPALSVLLCVWLLLQSPAGDLLAAGTALVAGYVLCFSTAALSARRARKQAAGI